MRSRKGQGWVAESGVIIISMIVLFLAVLAFYILFKTSLNEPVEFTISGTTSDIDLGISLNNVLNTPVEIGTETMTIREAIERGHFECGSKTDLCEVYVKFLRQELSTIMDALEHEYESLYDSDLKEYRRCRATYSIDLAPFLIEPNNPAPYDFKVLMSGYVRSDHYPKEMLRTDTTTTAERREWCFREHENNHGAAVHTFHLADGTEYYAMLSIAMRTV